MLPPLASTSCTDMLIPLLLLMNGLLFVVHELELKRQRFEIRVFDTSNRIGCVRNYLSSQSTPSRLKLHFADLTQACRQVSRRRRVSWRCRPHCTTWPAVVPGSDWERTPDRRNHRCCRPRRPSSPVRSPTSVPRTWTGGQLAFSWSAEVPRIRDTASCQLTALHVK